MSKDGEGRMVILGAGHAGGRAAEAMRQAGHAGPIDLVGEETHRPYERPPLSKELLAGDMPVEKIFLHPQPYYAEQGITLHLGQRAESIDRAGRRVILADGRILPYDRLLIATGGRVRRLACPGAELAGVHTLRNLDDTLSLHPLLGEGARLVVIGGGFIGLEVAATARKRGARVTVVELADQVLARVADPAIGAMVADLHRRNGVEILTGASVERIEGNGKVDSVVCTDGMTLPADAVVVGIGILPNLEIARDAGLETANGITADSFGRTSDPDIFVAGDVAFQFNPLLGRHLRLESWANAQNGGMAAARNMVAEPIPFAEVPWFWTDQFTLNLQTAGAPERWDRLVVRGDADALSCVIFAMEGRRVVGASTFNMGREMRFCRKLIESGREVADSDLADSNRKLRDLAG